MKRRGHRRVYRRCFRIKAESIIERTSRVSRQDAKGFLSGVLLSVGQVAGKAMIFGCRFTLFPYSAIRAFGDSAARENFFGCRFAEFPHIGLRGWIFGCRSAGFPCSTVVRLDCRVAVGGILVVDGRNFHDSGASGWVFGPEGRTVFRRRFSDSPRGDGLRAQGRGDRSFPQRILKSVRSKVLGLGSFSLRLGRRWSFRRHFSISPRADGLRA
jgi:hypothetical protein